ncbi:hypothetical protein HBI56_168100 [Parastagonospora nodorum]|uniref:Uncharacterized protein n=1 Tax=Phaeosphaeria nodorum (strain SN15 / ATCC MYA-4574 / FGSC 10173) TaxID=321614 RepID=A0A7U2FB70_PHANO|nr:hypothetical protein HBH56_050640 [Parastagonospora nodorum]QRD02078.1 hypothetical protein JI435_417520 [Parastagonospora nodorum SN15]KAH3935531.1 hypothetical protein HBH54_036430 [Parastagonospora nodorum]KAH3942709.1 hypothetical protein HBH53_183530 [Parastagonospora nodorum]KAH3964056.1 hypothetical protein HBH51_162300 [Parastagonospora nodorum]
MPDAGVGRSIEPHFRIGNTDIKRYLGGGRPLESGVRFTLGVPSPLSVLGYRYI